MNFKKTLILIVIFFSFCQGIYYLNDRFNSEVLDDHYSEEYEEHENNLWSDIVVYFEGLFEEDEEHYIYK